MGVVMARSTQNSVLAALVFLGSALGLLIGSVNARADVLGFLAGDTISKAMDQGRETVDRARDAALAIEAQTNEDVTDRLNQVQAIADEQQAKLAALEYQTFSDANQLQSRTVEILDDQQTKLNSLERKFMNDLSARIRQFECSSDKILQEQLKDALGKIGVFFGSNEISITPPVLYDGEHTRCKIFWSCRIVKVFPVRTPFAESYKEIKGYLEGRLQEVREDTSAESVIETYSLIADFAKRTACFTEANNQTYEREFVKYSTVVRHWNNALSFGE